MSVVGNLGDSRAYWLGSSAGDRRQLTVDDTCAEERVAEGVDPEVAYAEPEAGDITRWIGADAESTDPAVVDVRRGRARRAPPVHRRALELLRGPRGAGSAGSAPSQATGDPPDGGAPADRRRPRRGGHDNITVAVVPVTPEASGNSAPTAWRVRAPRGKPSRTSAMKEGVSMADFTIECFQNEYLPAGANQMHVVISVTAPGRRDGRRDSEPPPERTEIIILDTSGRCRASGSQRPRLRRRRSSTVCPRGCVSPS